MYETLKIEKGMYKMKKKLAVIVIAIIAIMSFLIGHIISYANNGSIYVNITETNLNGIGYGIGDPENGGAGRYIWVLRTYNSENASDLSATQRNLYCIKAEYGEAWNPVNNGTIVEYNLSYDLQDDREKLINLLRNSSSEANEMVLELLNPQGEAYRELLWILDNAYIAGETDKDEFLAKFGIVKDEYGYYNENTHAGYDYILTDDDIKAVQSAAIWHFTNYAVDGDATYNQEGKSEWLTITEDGQTYENLSEITRFESEEGANRNEQAALLYDYLVQQATANADIYNESNNYKLQGSVSVNTSGLTQNSDGEYILLANQIDSNFIIGPIKIDENTNEIKNIKKDIKYYAFVIIALMIILQPKVIEFISTIFSVSK